MRYLKLVALFSAVGLGAFSLAISGLGALGNAVVFALAAGGLLFTTVNLTSAKRAAHLAKEAQSTVANVVPPAGAQPLTDNAQ